MKARAAFVDSTGRVSIIMKDPPEPVPDGVSRITILDMDPHGGEWCGEAMVVRFERDGLNVLKEVTPVLKTSKWLMKDEDLKAMRGKVCIAVPEHRTATAGVRLGLW